jgi:hypothetical protein
VSATEERARAYSAVPTKLKRESGFMRRAIISGFVMAMLLCSQTPALQQSIDCQNALQRARGMRLEVKERRPEKAVDYGQAARFKLSTHKTKYQFGDVVNVSTAMLNKTDAPIYFYRLLHPEFRVRDEKGSEIEVEGNLLDVRYVRESDYSLLAPGYFIAQFDSLVVGCAGAKTANDKEAFDKNQFVNQMLPCFRANEPGKYTITAELEVHHVVTSECDPSVKTAVGKILSEPLTITITR